MQLEFVYHIVVQEYAFSMCDKKSDKLFDQSDIYPHPYLCYDRHS